jgi:hypothetical protein
VAAAERAWKPNQHTAEEDTMNIETLELNAAAEATKADETFDLLALSADDLDLVGGGNTIGSLA